MPNVGRGHSVSAFDGKEFMRWEIFVHAKNTAYHPVHFLYFVGRGGIGLKQRDGAICKLLSQGFLAFYKTDHSNFTVKAPVQLRQYPLCCRRQHIPDTMRDETSGI